MPSSSTTPLITWLLPVRNGMPYLPRTLESIARQTYLGFEVIAWDNGSTDGSAKVLRQWIPWRLPGRVITDKPRGLGASLAAMVEMSQTPLCARIDADDVNEPRRLEAQVRFLEQNPRVGIVGSAIHFIDSEDRLRAGAAAPELADVDIRWRMRFSNPLFHPTVMFRREAVLRAGNYRDVMPVEDYDLWVRLARQHRMGNIAEPLVRYRVHATSVTGVRNHQAAEIRERFQDDAAPLLFPGMNRDEVRRLYHVLRTPGDLGVTRSDIRLLHRAAGCAATAFGDNPDDLRRCELYRQQRLNLWTRWLKGRRLVAPAWPLLRGAAGLFQPRTEPMQKAA